MANKPPRNHVTIAPTYTKRCAICSSSEVTYVVSYRDADRPGNTTLDGKYIRPTDQKHSCDQHVEQVTYLILKDAGLVQDAINTQDEVKCE